MRAMLMTMDKDEEKTGLEEQIDENLRRVYRQRVEERIPDRFEDLLRKLREQDDPV